MLCHYIYSFTHVTTVWNSSFRIYVFDEVLSLNGVIHRLVCISFRLDWSKWHFYGAARLLRNAKNIAALRVYRLILRFYPGCVF